MLLHSDFMLSDHTLIMIYVYCRLVFSSRIFSLFLTFDGTPGLSFELPPLVKYKELARERGEISHDLGSFGLLTCRRRTLCQGRAR